HEKCLTTGDNESDCDVDFTAAKLDIRSPNRKDRAKDQREENIQVAPDVMGKVVRVCFAHLSAELLARLIVRLLNRPFGTTTNIGLETGISKRGPRNARTSRISQSGW